MVKLNDADSKFRDFALEGNMWKVIFRVCFPLAVFQIVNHIFNVLDSMMASYISAQAVSAIAYISQIQQIIAAVGTGLAAGGSLKISLAYGAGDYETVKKRLSSLIGLCFAIGLAVMLLLPFTSPFLRMMGTPESFIETGARYFQVTVIATVLNFFNNVYISIERTRGNSKRIMYLNIGIIVIKLLLTAVFVYVVKGGITMIATATVISQMILFIIAVKNLRSGKDAFSFESGYVSFKKKVIAPMVGLSFPVVVEKMAFALGKSIVNAMSKDFGEIMVGALGISNNICGTVTNIHVGFQDGVSAIISQNLGAGKKERALEAFKKCAIINAAIGTVGMILLITFIDGISVIFANSANGFDYDFQQNIIMVFMYDCIGGCVPLGINCAVMALLFGIGKTRISLFINFCRVFVFRVPVLWILRDYTDIGSESVGIVMFVSNIATLMLDIIVGYIVVRKFFGKEKRKDEN